MRLHVVIAYWHWYLTPWEWQHARLAQLINPVQRCLSLSNWSSSCSCFTSKMLLKVILEILCNRLWGEMDPDRTAFTTRECATALWRSWPADLLICSAVLEQSHQRWVILLATAPSDLFWSSSGSFALWAAAHTRTKIVGVWRHPPDLTRFTHCWTWVTKMVL